MKKIITTIASLIATVQCMAATTWYVTKSGNDSNTGKSESASFLTIQKAIDSSAGGDLIIVNDGTYSPISTDNKEITIKSKNGAAQTIIDGGGSSRCATLGSAATHRSTNLNGFTLQNGKANYGSGGGSYCGTLVNCIIKGNYSYEGSGGGAMYGWLYQCMVLNNADESSIYSSGADCYGGGACSSRLFNCIITGNSHSGSRGSTAGLHDCDVCNCIVYRNELRSCDASNSYVDKTYATGYDNNLKNCIHDAPNFVDDQNGNYQLLSTSPCIDAGDNLFAFGSKDLGGSDRITNGKVDIGPYEWNSESEGISIDVDCSGPFSATWYVTKSGNDSNTGKSEADAFLTIQKAIDSSSEGDLIIVGDGTYAAISTNNKKITIKSKNGAAQTIIDGGGSSRCATLGSAATHRSTNLNGFTLQNGKGGSGAGSYCGTLVNCIIKGNYAYNGSGGGAMYGWLYQCLVMNNKDESSGYTTDPYCYGGGACSARLFHCIVTGNSYSGSRGSTAGLYDCEVHNCIVYRNELRSCDASNSYVDKTYATGYDNNLKNCIHDAPNFVDDQNGNYQLLSTSPCIDAGDNLFAFGSKDLGGSDRITNGKVDIGPYEWNSSTGGISIDDGTGGRQTADIKGDGSSGGGTHYIGDTVTLIAPYVNVTNGWTNIVCTGWTNGTGDIPATGTEASYTFTLTKASSLKWVYATNYYVRVTAEAGGEIQTSGATDAWLPMGILVSYTAVASNGWMFTSWLDMGDGVTQIKDNPIARELDAPCVVKAQFKSEMIDYDITDVVAHQRYPWNGKVDLDFTLTCADTEAEFSIGFAAVDQIGQTNLLMQTMRYDDKGDVKQKFNLKAGHHRVTWDADADIPKSVLDSVKFTVFAGVAE